MQTACNNEKNIEPIRHNAYCKYNRVFCKLMQIRNLWQTAY